jgi:hypothetical protein
VVEHLTFNQRVTRSNRVGLTNFRSIYQTCAQLLQAV